MAAMRERAIILLDVTGLGLLVAGAWSTWGIGAGLGALGASSLIGALYVEFVVPRRQKGPA